MRRHLLVGLLVATSFGTVGAPQAALAGDGFGAGLFGGLIAGTIIGAASAPRYYGPPVVYGAPEPVYAAPACYWTRGEPAWDDYRGMWVRPRVRVCD